MATPKIKETAVLIGYNSDDKCVYSEIISIHDYYDREHVWDNTNSVKRLKLKLVKGFLFKSDGVLEQEFESVFDPETGKCVSGRRRFADGTESSD